MHLVLYLIKKTKKKKKKKKKSENTFCDFIPGTKSASVTSQTKAYLVVLLNLRLIMQEKKSCNESVHGKKQICTKK